MKDLATLIHRELSGEMAQEITAAICDFHRSPGAAGYHAATNIVADRLRQFGLQVDVTTYPLDAETPVGDGPLGLAWEPYGAVIRTVNPVQELVVDFDQVPSCLAWHSKPTPPGGITAQLIDVGTGESDADYAGKDVKGNIAFVSHTERPGGWTYAAQQLMQRGAAGIISDYLFYEFTPHRTRQGNPDLVQLLRLPNGRGQYDIWACSIDYHAAQRLRHLLKLGPVTLHADIRCRQFKGHGQNVLATIPGRELPDESVFFIAHTSAATKPCANCAAGPALMVEIARTLHHLVESGRVPRPRRSIKFLYIIEGSGSKAYIAAHEHDLHKVKTAFCFDSVGHHQDKLKSVLLFYRHPDSAPAFINDYFQGVMDRAPKDGTWVFAEKNDISPVKFVQAPYTPWSDNHTWAAYGVPSPLIMSWPDQCFHTQALTPDKTDPRVFRTCGITTALAAYEIADAGLDEALSIADEVAARSLFRLEETANRAVQRLLGARKLDGSADLERIASRARRELAYFSSRDARNIASALALVPGGAPAEAHDHVEAHGAALRAAAERAVARVNRTLARLQKGGVA